MFCLRFVFMGATRKSRNCPVSRWDIYTQYPSYVRRSLNVLLYFKRLVSKDTFYWPTQKYHLATCAAFDISASVTTDLDSAVIFISSTMSVYFSVTGCWNV